MIKESVTYKVIFAVGRFGAVILNCNEIVKDLIERVTISRLHGFVSNVGDIPTELGLYTGLLTLSFADESKAENLDLNYITDVKISGCLTLNKFEL